MIIQDNVLYITFETPNLEILRFKLQWSYFAANFIGWLNILTGVMKEVIDTKKKYITFSQ